MDYEAKIKEMRGFITKWYELNAGTLERAKEDNREYTVVHFDGINYALKSVLEYMDENFPEVE